MTLYDIPDFEILKETGMCEADIKKYLKTGNYSIRTFDDLILELKDCNLLENELDGMTIEEFKNKLTIGKWDCADSGIMEYNGEKFDYVVTYEV